MTDSEKIKMLEFELASAKIEIASAKQETQILKSNVERMLKLQYADLASVDSLKCNDDNFMFLTVTLKQTFKILKRIGFEF